MCIRDREDILQPLLIGDVQEVRQAARAGGFDIADIRIVDPLHYRRMDELVDKMVEPVSYTHLHCAAA